MSIVLFLRSWRISESYGRSLKLRSELAKENICGCRLGEIACPKGLITSSANRFSALCKACSRSRKPEFPDRGKFDTQLTIFEVTFSFFFLFHFFTIVVFYSCSEGDRIIIWSRAWPGDNSTKWRKKKKVFHLPTFRRNWVKKRKKEKRRRRRRRTRITLDML